MCFKIDFLNLGFFSLWVFFFVSCWHFCCTSSFIQAGTLFFVVLIRLLMMMVFGRIDFFFFGDHVIRKKRSTKKMWKRRSLRRNLKKNPKMILMWVKGRNLFFLMLVRDNLCFAWWHMIWFIRWRRKDMRLWSKLITLTEQNQRLWKQETLM